MSPSSRAGSHSASRGAKRRASPPRRDARRRRASKGRRAAASRTGNRWIAIAAAAATAVLVVFVGAVALVGATVRPFGECRIEAFAPRDAPLSVQGWDAEQLHNAAVIMTAGRDLGLSVRDQAVGVMTAMGESSLRNLDYGDWETSGVTNPDGSRTTSIGLFQQQDAWGTREQRLDPYSAAMLFYRAMAEAVPESERHAVEPTIIAHRTQINANPQHYARYWPMAVRVVEQLSGTETGLDSATGEQAC